MALALAAKRPDDERVRTLVQQLAGFEPAGISPETLAQLGTHLLEADHLVLLWDGKEADMAQVLALLAMLREKPTRVLPTFGPANWRGFERAGFPAQFDELTRLLQRARDGEIKMLMVFGADLLREYPKRQLVEEAFNQVEYLVVESVLPPEGLSHVDALLPGAGWAEVYGTYINMEGRIQVAMAGVQPPGQARPVKTYLTTWAHHLMKTLNVEDDWDPFDDDSGDLLPPQPIDQEVHPVLRPEESGADLVLITGSLIWESGQPSEILAPRIPEFTGKINDQDAQRLGLPMRACHILVSQDGESIVAGVAPDSRVPRGILWLPQGVFGANRLHNGPVTAQVVHEEVTA